MERFKFNTAEIIKSMTKAHGATTVEHENGLHARPASVFVRTASDFDSEVAVSKLDDEGDADAKSSIAVISLGIEPGDEIKITAEGSDADEAVERLITLVEHDFEAKD